MPAFAITIRCTTLRAIAGGLGMSGAR